MTREQMVDAAVRRIRDRDGVDIRKTEAHLTLNPAHELNCMGCRTFIDYVRDDYKREIARPEREPAFAVRIWR